VIINNIPFFDFLTQMGIKVILIIKRQIFNKLLSELTKPEASLLIGSRQVGKTFLLNQLFKYYFFDLGIRNAILRDFSKIERRRDKGTIYETFIYLILKKTLKPNESLYFWRTKQGHEVDFIKLINRKPMLIEVKADLNQPTIPKGVIAFIKRYPDTQQAYILNNKIVHDTYYQNTASFIFSLHFWLIKNI
jgi:predicted AAA+ superfamily ATPase